jgi:hypothetical protein
MREATMAKKNNNSSMADDLRDAAIEVTKDWTKTIKAEERDPSSRFYRRARMTREKTTGFKEAAEEIMEQAYLDASDPLNPGGPRLYANARQIAYQARNHIQNATGKPLQMNYFTQTLLPDYCAEHNPDWTDNVVWDARGHFTEPHDDGQHFGIGHVDVRQYLEDIKEPQVVAAGFSQAHVDIIGPKGNYSGILFVEKEGFDELIMESSQILARFDLAYMSTKGMSVTAARELVDNICKQFNIPLCPRHDFDLSVFSIAASFERDTRRYEFKNTFQRTDLGLRLDDIKKMGLEDKFEYQYHAKGDKSVFIDRMREYGATEEEIEFMFRDFDSRDHPRCTRRVELNAMKSRQIIQLIERKLRENKITKIIPNQKLLAETYVAMERGRLLEMEVEKIEKINMKGFKVPKDLKRLVQAEQKKDPSIRWDAAIAALIQQLADDE